MQCVVMKNIFVLIMHLATLNCICQWINLPEHKTVKIFLQNKTVLQRMNVPIQDMYNGPRTDELKISLLYLDLYVLGDDALIS